MEVITALEHKMQKHMGLGHTTQLRKNLQSLIDQSVPKLHTEVLGETEAGQWWDSLSSAEVGRTEEGKGPSATEQTQRYKVLMNTTEGGPNRRGWNKPPFRKDMANDLKY